MAAKTSGAAGAVPAGQSAVPGAKACTLKGYSDKGKPVELPPDSIVINSNIVADQLCEVNIKQRYTNKEAENITRVRYTFPVETDAAVHQLRGYVYDWEGQKKLELIGVCKPAEEAKEEYQREVDAGRSAALLSQGGAEDILVLDIGNLEYYHTVEINVKYITSLDMEGDNIRFRIPAYLAPRYGYTAKDAKGETIEGAPVTYPIDVNVNIQCASQVLSIQSPTYNDCLNVQGARTMKVEGDSCRARVKMKIPPEEAGLSDDIILLIEPEEPNKCHCTLERSLALKSECLRVSLCLEGMDDVAAMSEPVEYIFLLDASTSMMGHVV